MTIVAWQIVEGIEWENSILKLKKKSIQKVLYHKSHGIKFIDHLSKGVIPQFTN